MNGSISADGVKLDVTNINFHQGGVSISAGSELTVRNTKFNESINGILTGGGNVKIDVQNCEFVNVMGKGIVILSEIADTTVKDCTFTAGLFGNRRPSQFRSIRL